MTSLLQEIKDDAIRTGLEAFHDAYGDDNRVVLAIVTAVEAALGSPMVRIEEMQDGTPPG